MLGTNKDEGTLFVYSNEPAPLDTDAYKYRASKLLDRFGPMLKLEDFLTQYPPAAAGADNRPVLSEAFGDIIFNCPTNWVAGLHGNANVYSFQCRRKNDPSPPEWGVYHSSELPVVFDDDKDPFNPSHVMPFTAAESNLSWWQGAYWSSLAAAGDVNGKATEPPPPGTPDRPHAWPKYAAPASSKLVLDLDLSVTTDSAQQLARCAFWQPKPDGGAGAGRM